MYISFSPFFYIQVCINNFYNINLTSFNTRPTATLQLISISQILEAILTTPNFDLAPPQYCYSDSQIPYDLMGLDDAKPDIMTKQLTKLLQALDDNKVHTYLFPFREHGIFVSHFISTELACKK